MILVRMPSSKKNPESCIELSLMFSLHHKGLPNFPYLRAVFVLCNDAAFIFNLFFTFILFFSEISPIHVTFIDCYYFTTLCR